MRVSLKSVLPLSAFEAATLLEYEREGGMLNMQQTAKAILAMRGAALCSQEQFDALMASRTQTVVVSRHNTILRKAAKPAPVTTIEAIEITETSAAPASDFLIAALQSDRNVRRRNHSRFDYVCADCGCEFTRKIELDPSLPIYCTEHLAERRASRTKVEIVAESHTAEEAEVEEVLVADETLEVKDVMPVEPPKAKPYVPPGPVTHKYSAAPAPARTTDTLSVVFAPVMVEYVPVEPPKAKPNVPPGPTTVKYVAPTNAPAPIAAPAITAPPADPETNDGCPPVAEEDSDFVIEADEIWIDTDAEDEEPVVLTAYDRIGDRFEEVIEMFHAKGIRFGLTPPRNSVELQARLESSAKWMARNPVEMIEAFLARPVIVPVIEEVETITPEPDAKVEEDAGAQAKADDEASKTDEVIELDVKQLGRGKEILRLFNDLVQVGILQNVLCKPTTADALTNEIRRQLGQTHVMGGRIFLPSLAKNLVH